MQIHLPKKKQISAELKRDDDDISKARSQMSVYMTRIDKICSPGNGFKGFLVLKNVVQVFSYVGHGAYWRPEHVDSYSMFDAGNPTYRQDFPIDNPAHVIRSYAVFCNPNDSTSYASECQRRSGTYRMEMSSIPTTCWWTHNIGSLFLWSSSSIVCYGLTRFHWQRWI